MSEGRSLVFPRALGFGASPRDVPGRGNVLCASAFFVFRLSDGAHIEPSLWYEAVATHGGPLDVPDSLTPLPGAEVLVLGALPPVVDTSRAAFLRCGSVERQFVLYRDPEAPGAPVRADPGAARWHEQDNPGGRGGPGDERPALIVDGRAPETPLWLGSTPFDHPTRLRRVGTAGADSGTGWPEGTEPAVLHDAHAAFWTEALYPGEPLAFDGLAAHALETSLPRYRVSITSGWVEGRWATEAARIHCVTLLPEADLGAVFWRAGIALGDDILGEKVGALVVALEDPSDPVRDEGHWADIAIERWLNPERAMDDRPLLPAALAASVAPPFAPPPGDDPIGARHAAADAWAREEFGLPETNPFAGDELEAAKLADEMQTAAAQEEGDEPPDMDAMGTAAQGILAVAARRHEEAGFERPEGDPDVPRKPEVRGAGLSSEITLRLSGPYVTPIERMTATGIAGAGIDSLEPSEILRSLTEARLLSPQPPLFWPALDEDESVRFGDALVERLEAEDLQPHIDVSGAAVATGAVMTGGWMPGRGNGGNAPVATEPGRSAHERVEIGGRRIDGLLAEETTWRGVRFARCEFVDASFAGGRFEECEFEECTFEKVNLSRATLRGNRFSGCTLRNLQLVDPVWMECTFDKCTFEQVSFTDPAMRDLTFEGGAWHQVQLTEALMIRVVLRGTDMREVMFALTHAPYTRFERLSMFKVWAMAWGRGFPESVFEDVHAVTCGFASTCRFDGTRFERTRFAKTGFTGAVFQGVHCTADCEFEACDFSSAVFADAKLAGVRFLQCTMATSVWSGVDAAQAWFFGSILRGVDFADTHLERAVLADSDLEGATFQEDRTIGADFRGTVRSGG